MSSTPPTGSSPPPKPAEQQLTPEQQEGVQKMSLLAAVLLNVPVQVVRRGYDSHGKPIRQQATVTVAQLLAEIADNTNEIADQNDYLIELIAEEEEEEEEEQPRTRRR